MSTADYKPVHLYRYELNWDRQSLLLSTYNVIKTTPKGAWIQDDSLKLRFILQTARKQWANKTPTIALEAFKARKRRQISILASNLDQARLALAIALGIDLSTKRLTDSALKEPTPSWNL